MSSTIGQITTGITDTCIRCDHIIVFEPRDGVHAWRHLRDHVCACDDPSPEQLSMRVITDRFLEEEAK